MNGSRFDALTKTLIPHMTQVAGALAADRWFDALNKVLIWDVPRRTIVQSAATVAASLALGGRGAEAARNRKNKGKGKTKKKRKGKGKTRPKTACSGGACAAVPEWAGNQGQIDYCEFVCRQCDRANPRQFCIVELPRPDGTLTNVADCCPEGSECCEHQCCGDSRSPYLRCCRGKCVDIGFDNEHCNGCSQACPTGATCADGGCRCPEGQTVCGAACQECCFDGDCDNNMDCLDGSCGCGRGKKPCDGACILADDCCTDADCPDLLTCQPCGGPPGRCCGLPPGS